MPVKERLSDGRPIRTDNSNMVRQVEMFQLRGKFDPKTEHIAKLKELDDALNASSLPLKGAELRSAEYGFYHRSRTEPLGEALIWEEKEVRYMLRIPDIPVMFDEKEISLRKVVGGVVVIPTIELLKIHTTPNGLFVVSPIDPAALVGKVRVIKIGSCSEVEGPMDEHGFPDSKAYSENPSDIRRLRILSSSNFPGKSTGWHGSFIRHVSDSFGNDERREIITHGLRHDCWFEWAYVMFAGNETVKPPLEAVQEPGKLILSGSDEHIQAALKALKSQNLI